MVPIILRCAAALLLSAACQDPTAAAAGATDEAEVVERGEAHASATETVADRPERGPLGIEDRGIFPDLAAQVRLPLPRGLTAADVTAEIDARHGVLVVVRGETPLTIYPLGRGEELVVGKVRLHLRPADRAELAPLLTAANLSVQPATRGDLDDDGIPDTLDVVVGARKTVLNGDEYQEGYVSIPFPGGDVPRTMGVCTDVVIRAVRNAGLDLQAEVQRDIRRSPRSYPMVRRRNSSIDHRRVKTLLPYFVRNWEAHTAALDDPADPVRPGDVVFLDTFATRPGPDHIGVVSDRVGPGGRLLVINNWTNGTRTSDMDLLAWVPVTHRFRIPPRAR